FSPRLVVADATDVDSWWQGEMFDKILLDVPCSATGVIRRHPDIKQLRKEEDIQVLVELQRDILQKNWALLKPGGRLLYATCSLFKAENQQQIAWFLKNTPDAQLIDISAYVQLKGDTQGQEEAPVSSQAGPQADLGLQLFPASQNNDGFYYALLEKNTD
ncbi:16S rRNA (cytosine(967)-C(5))-methyltransferase, partial [hydrothermal vent metagenome]